MDIRHFLTLRHRVALTGTLFAFGLSACKQQEAPKPDDKSKSQTGSTVTPPAYPTPPPAPPIDQGEETEEGEYDSSSGCSYSRCKDAGTLEIVVDGSESQTLAIDPNVASKTWTLSVRSERYDDRTFRLSVTSDTPNLKVTENDTSSVSVAWVQGASSGVTQGRLKITARDEMRCEKQGSGECSDMDNGNEYDEDLTLPWSTDGTVVSGNGSGDNGSSGLALSVGLNLVASLLGLDIGPSTFYGTNKGQIGGGFANGATNGAYGWAGDGSYQNGNGYNNGYNNGVNGNGYNNGYNNGVNGNGYNNGYNNGTNGNGYNNGYNNGTNGSTTCSLANCTRCTELQCENVGCSWDYASRLCQ